MEPYTVSFVGDITTADPYYTNIDVYVTFPTTNHKYVTTFYTLAHIIALNEFDRVQGNEHDSLYGLYFLDPSRIIVRELTETTVKQVVADLLEKGIEEFEKVFSGGSKYYKEPATPYVLHIPVEWKTVDAYGDSLDVYVEFPESRRRYVSTFYTIPAVLRRMEAGRTSGENLNGLYFYDGAWLIIRTLTEANIRAVIDDRLQYGMYNFEQAFRPAFVDERQ